MIRISIDMDENISYSIDMETINNDISKPLLERFLRYVKTCTTSDQIAADAGQSPSTECQREFAYTLESELKAIGISDVHVTEHAYVCARIPATPGYEKIPSVGFLAHMDTVQGVSGKNVNPQIIENYDGNLITLKEGITLDPSLDTQLLLSKGETIITTDGTTLLGADDKAGLAAIMTAIDIVLNGQKAINSEDATLSNIQHGQIEIIFSPDEETGHGMDNVPLSWIQSKSCYTLDGSHIGEVEVECFSAYKSEITFIGKSKHTGTARPDMINAVTMASSFINLLPQNESPEATDGYIGFFAPMKIEGHLEKSKVVLYLRDFDDDSMQRRIKTVDALAKAIECRFNGSSVIVEHTKQYQNMKKKLDEHPHVAQILFQAVENLHLNLVCNPIRGGTDGSRLTEMGVPTPNIFTGGHNFHSRSEWASLNQMTYAVRMVLEIITLNTIKGAN